MAELRRCEAFGIPLPGVAPGQLHRRPERRPGAKCRRLHPLPAGGSRLGRGAARDHRRAAAPRSGAPSRSSRCCAAWIGDEVRHRVAFCADTCHLYSAGYDLVGDYDGVWRQWEQILGLDQLRCLHLNDSKTTFASRRDRHELIGEGSLGPGPFRRIMTDPRLAHVIKILETPRVTTGSPPTGRCFGVFGGTRGGDARALTRSPSPIILSGMRAVVALLVVLTAAGLSAAEAQADFYARLGVTGATKLVKDDILQQIEVRQSLAPTLALGVSVPFTPLYWVGLEATVTSSGYHSTESGSQTDLGTLRTGSIMLGLGARSGGSCAGGRERDCSVTGRPRSAAYFLKGGTTRFLVGAGSGLPAARIPTLGPDDVVAIRFPSLHHRRVGHPWLQWNRGSAAGVGLGGPGAGAR